MQYAIYARPSDHPFAAFLVREWAITPTEVTAGRVLGTANTIGEARALVPPQADFRQERQDDDDPVIVETWI